MKLIIAEKPSVARDIARVLGCKPAEGAYSNGEYAIVWAIGHLVTLCEPGETDPAWKKWNAALLPMLPQTIPLKVIDKTKAQFNTVKRWMKKREVNAIICATDAGREGELIFRHIYEMVFSSVGKPVERLWISSLTTPAIRKGFDELKPGKEYDGLHASARCRAEADWLVGMNASRAYSLASGETLSIGRVQTPTLAFLVRRQAEIDAFVPQEYANIIADFAALEDSEGYNGAYISEDYPDGRVFDLERAKTIAKRVKGGTGIVKSVEKEEVKTPPPLLHDLTSLQREANARQGLTAKATLAAAQSLYEKHKAITYPRTDSRFLTRDLVPTLPKRLEAIAKISDYTSIIQPLLGQKPPISGRIVFDAKVHDHHAIIPTGRLPASATAPEKAVFDIICRAFIAAFYPPEIAQRTTVLTDVGEDRFKTVGRVVEQPGWRAVYGQSPNGENALTSKEKEEEPALPEIKKGEARPVSNVTIKKKKTVPPKPYTDATLLYAMQTAGRTIDDGNLAAQIKDCGLGTPATRAAILERLLTVGYAQRRGKTLLPTQKGISCIALMPEILTSAETTAKWERALARIADNEMDPARFMESMSRLCTFLVQHAAGGKQSQDVAAGN